MHIPELPHNGSSHNRETLEEILVLLIETGFDIALLYAAEVDVDWLIMEILRKLGHNR